MLRKFHASVDMLPQVLVAGVISLCVARVFAPPFAATGRDLAVLAIMGAVQLGIGCLLATAASRRLRATELGLLALLEPILGPCGSGCSWARIPAPPRSPAARSSWVRSGQRGVRASGAHASRRLLRLRPTEGYDGGRFLSPPSMKQTFLDFEQPIAELQQRSTSCAMCTRIRPSTSPTRSRASPRRASSSRARSTARLSAWQIAQVARHPQRPYTLDYINGMFSEFRELHGDRTFADDPPSSAAWRASTASRAW
jgi:hypothetical protein